jgi:hypothetical protein
MVDIHFHGKLAIQQRVLTPYRATFFDRLAASCEGGLSIFAGTPRPTEAITLGTLKTAQYMPAHNLHLLDGPFYLCWQPNIQDWLAGWDPQALILEANPRYLSTPAAIRWMTRRDRCPPERKASMGDPSFFLSADSRNASAWSCFWKPAQRNPVIFSPDWSLWGMDRSARHWKGWQKTFIHPPNSPGYGTVWN